VKRKGERENGRKGEGEKGRVTEWKNGNLEYWNCSKFKEFKGLKRMSQNTFFNH
jgi:hypothetical protein